MRTRRLIPLIFLLMIQGLTPLHAEEEKLKVYDDLNEAKAIAQKENKPVFLEFMLTGCSFCEAFKENVLDDPDFIKFANRELVVVIYDRKEFDRLGSEERAERLALMKKLKIKSYPTVLLLSPRKGRILLQKRGYDKSKTAADVIKALKAKMRAD